MKTKEEMLNDIKRALEVIDEEIICYGYTLDITTKTNTVHVNNYISITKNRSALCPSPIINE